MDKPITNTNATIVDQDVAQALRETQAEWTNTALPMQQRIAAGERQRRIYDDLLREAQSKFFQEVCGAVETGRS